MSVVDKKVCTGCGLEKRFSEFHKNKLTKDGILTRCKTCQNATMKKRNDQTGYNRHGKGKYVAMSKKAKEMRLPFLLKSPAQLEEWWRETPEICYYCGQTQAEHDLVKDYVDAYDGMDHEVNKLKQFLKSPRHRNLTEMTIDRMDSGRGYSIDNMVKACWICNAAKGGFFKPDDFRAIQRRDMPHILARAKHWERATNIEQQELF